MNYYELLEVREEASPEVIQMAHKALVKKYHPDVYNGDTDIATDILQKINEAYGVLSNSETRKAYDNELKYIRSGAGANESTLKAKEETKGSTARRFFDPFEDKKEASPLPTKWLTFFSVCLCLGSIFGVIKLIYSIIEIGTYGFWSTDYLSFNIYVTILYVLDFLSVLLCISLFISFRKPTLITFILTKIFLAFMPCYLLFFIISSSPLSEPLYIIIAIMPSIVYSLLSLIYFEKRKYLFDDNAAFPTMDANGKYKTTYIVRPSIIFLIILILVLSVAALYSSYSMDSFAYLTPEQENESQQLEKVQEQPTTDLEIATNFNELAKFYDWDTYSDFIIGLEENFDIELQNLSPRAAYEKIATELFGIQSFDETLGLIDPYLDTAIESFGDYQRYVLAAIKEYESTQSE